MKTDKKLFGMKLALLRRRKDLSQEYCAECLKCSRRQWGRWERGEAYPRPIFHSGILNILPELVKI